MIFLTMHFPFGTSREIDLGYARVRATRISYVGELGWELYVPTEFVAGCFRCLFWKTVAAARAQSCGLSCVE